MIININSGINILTAQLFYHLINQRKMPKGLYRTYEKCENVLGRFLLIRCVDCQPVGLPLNKSEVVNNKDLTPFSVTPFSATVSPIKKKINNI